MKTSIKTLGLAFGLGFGDRTAPASAEDLKFMTGPQGGSWIPLGGQLKDMWEKAIPGLQVQALPGAGIANVRGVDEGKADIGFGNSISTVDGVAGNAPFPKKVTNVCNIATLYPQYYQLVVPADSGINSIADLKGKAITTQQRGNTGELITRQLLGVNGLKYDDVKVSFVGYSDSVNQMKDGHAVAFGLGTQVPAGAIMDLASARPIKLLDQIVELCRHEEAQSRLHAGDRQEGQLSRPGQGREGDRLRDPHLRVVQAAGRRGLQDDQGHRSTTPRTWPASPRRSAGRRWPTMARISACRSIPARRNTTRKTASP